MNRLGQRGETDLGWNSAAYAARARAFGWHAIELDGHDLAAIDRAYAEALTIKDQPTVPGRQDGQGAAASRFVANKDGWHGKALNAEQAKAGPRRAGRRTAHRHPDAQAGEPGARGRRRLPQPLKLPTYALGSKEATRKAYGDALAALGASRPDVVALDAEVSNSTHADEFKKAYPDRFFEMFIAEQQMLGAAVGLGVLGKRAFASTFAAFFTRAYDQIRMAAISNATIHLSGSHAGVQHRRGRPVADGPRRPGHDAGGLRQHRPLPLRPQPDGRSWSSRWPTSRASPTCAPRARRRRCSTTPASCFPSAAAGVVKQLDKDRVAVIAAGITVHEALKAYDKLQGEGIDIRVIDAYSVKPIDQDDAAARRPRTTGGKLVVVEDHWPEGGLGDAVLDALGRRNR